MQPEIWKRFKEEITIWRVGALPGMALMGLVIMARLSGAMQPLEWLAFDHFLRLRPAEPIDERIIVVEINEDDPRIRQNYAINSAISDRDLSQLLLKLNKYQPRVIGLDIYRNLPVNPGYDELVKVLSETKNLVAIEKVLPDSVPPPPTLSQEQIGFADQLPDSDGKLRRSLLSTPSPSSSEYKFSLSLRLAEIYLAKAGITLENGIRDRHALRFGKTELPRFSPNAGGYIRTDAGGVQVLLNFRSGKNRFQTVSLYDIQNNKFNLELIRDRIVIIGITSPSRKDFITTSAIESTKPAPGRVYGVEIQAHAVSQIISAVLDKRPLLNTWPDIWEYLWIIAWGILGIASARLTKSPLGNFFIIVCASCSLITISYLSLIWGWWVPFVPAFLVLILNGIELTALYQNDHALRLGIKARQAIIERTFETIHNGPLQNLAKVLKLVRDRNNPSQELLTEIEDELEKLNQELRGIYEFLQREPPHQDNSLYLGRSLVLNLQDPLHEILYQVYTYTLEREFPCFRTIRIKILNFEPIDERHLTTEKKQSLCRFLEEALCNVGRHATGVTRLEVNCSSSEGWYTLSIVDDGLGFASSTEGRGTQQFRNFAKQFKGKFRRFPLSPKGTLCELSWPMRKFWF
ncbi:CHASE2 domain-containing protein [Nostoc sp. CMAA1605]|uniref:CHASE2 domain-containing protein n=1 Tax=Nostoc sp. CMAA1605 TaxID=2055159 RepID=UPI001F2BD959|nr:CHASE2 domain-containing protein [Nostoc sp. CMAA1605]MCF4970385.1 histidine kinase [Nostoc sp. CMAA1605]